MPMIDFKVVVLPAPLRPMSVTSSPFRTSKLMPWRMCDSPYQAWRSRTASNASPRGAGSGTRAAGAGSGGSLRAGSPIRVPHAAHISLHHRGVARDLGVGAFGQHLAARQHGDGVGEIGHDLHVVLDHQHGAV